MIGANIMLELDMVLYISSGVPASVIIPAIIIPLVTLLGSAALVGIVVLIFRRKYRAKEMESQHLTARMRI